MPLTPPQAYRKTAFTHRRGTAAARPAAADVLAGTLYYSTDTLVLERSTGVAWESYSSSFNGIITIDNLITTTTAGLTLINNTAATLAIPKQISPAVVFTGQGWDTDGAVSVVTKFALYNKPSTDTSPFPSIYFATDVGGGFVDQVLFGSANGDIGQVNWRIRDGNIIFSRTGRGISFVATPMTSAFDSSFSVSGDISGGNRRFVIRASPGYLFIESNNFGGGAGVIPTTDIRGFDDSVSSPLIYTRRRSVPGGAVANGFGGRELWQASSSTTADQNQGAIDIVWTDVTHATRTAKLSVSLVNSAAALAEKLALQGRGLLDVTAGYINWIGQKRTTAQFDKTNDAALANITGLSVNVEAGKVYYFEAQLFVDADVTGGHQYAIAGTATATSIIYQIEATDNTLLVFVITSREVALAGAAGQAGSTVVHTIIKGQIVVNAAGTLTVQFAQNAATPATTSSVLVGSTFIVQEMA